MECGHVGMGGEVPDKPWGIRSIPIISTRYPLWDQENLLAISTRQVLSSRCRRRSARNHGDQHGRCGADAVSASSGPTFVPMSRPCLPAEFLSFRTYHWWAAAGVSGALSFIAIVLWLWTGTAIIPEKDTKEVGLGLTLPTYVSGPSAVGWWAMFITMLGDMTAFVSLVFGYFFYWTVHEEFPPAEFDGREVIGPGTMWPLASVGLGLLAWVAVIWARCWNRVGHTVGFYSMICMAGSAGIASAVR